MKDDETPFADQVERELKAVYEFWDSFRTNPAVLAMAAQIRQAKEGA